MAFLESFINDWKYHRIDIYVNFWLVFLNQEKIKVYRGLQLLWLLVVEELWNQTDELQA